MMEELISETISRIEAVEDHSSGRSTVAKIHFDHAVRHLLVELWKSVKSLPLPEIGINKRSGYYSEHERDRNKLLTYRQVIAAYECLLKIGFIEVTQDGFYDKDTGEGEVTRVVAHDELLERLLGLEGHPALSLKANLQTETVLLRDTFDGRRTLIEL